MSAIAWAQTTVHPYLSRNFTSKVKGEVIKSLIYETGRLLKPERTEHKAEAGKISFRFSPDPKKGTIINKYFQFRESRACSCYISSCYLVGREKNC